MDELKINEKFKSLLPALSEEEFSQLEESVLADGVRESIKVWRGFIVDGHNRYAICTKHDLPYPVTDLRFESEDEVLEWIYINQLGRRNLSKESKLHFIGELYNLRKKKVGAPEENTNAEKQCRQNDDIESTELSYEIDTQFQKKSKSPTRTAEQMAKQFGVSPRTIERAGKVAEIVEEKPELKQEFLSGKVSQKEILESVKPKTAKSDSFVKAVQQQGRTIEKRIRLLNDALKTLDKLFTANGQNLEDFAPLLSKQFSIKRAVELRQFNYCGCEQGCGQCNQTGYTTKGK